MFEIGDRVIERQWTYSNVDGPGEIQFHDKGFRHGTVAEIVICSSSNLAPHNIYGVRWDGESDNIDHGHLGPERGGALKREPLCLGGFHHITKE